ncbi:hypothetical protein [Halomonas shengliensis]|uniref:hypothetical protein n=1 Tax=Halomonas shengliensis TaxID=419597 RepID=UPI0015A385A9
MQHLDEGAYPRGHMATLAIDGMEVGAHALPLGQRRHQASITNITFYLLDIADQLFEMRLILVNSATRKT